ncbi:PH domain-containing protein [Luteimicrobium subarcticum]|uniref:PH (Pleckstrin Homology) domain-containing protein n=1 Tax=Luteimicrobium subarcticum TaxID=620910 RepID=A0A2M8WUQ8_9MICO|nr:PH domain-containing protein [Luteimicrobium subarcticum]PJI94639.1 PH (Pleckstrin Homology) domain-containing protein [Luteimicrobium subarcticum]
MNPERHFSSPSGRVLTVAAALVALVVLVGVAADGGVHALAHVGAIPVLAAAVVWALYWRPEVVVSDGGVTVANPLRTTHVPWPTFVGVDTRWSLVVRTTDGEVTAWAAPRASGTARRVGRRPGAEERTVRGASAETVALEITGRHATLAAAGHLEGAHEIAAAHGMRPARRWDVPVVSTLGALAVLAVLGLALA